MTETATTPAPSVPTPHQYTAGELAHALLAVCDANPVHDALCTEAAHRLLLLDGANTGLVTEADRLRYQLRLAGTRTDDMRDSMVAINGRMDDMRRQLEKVAPRAPVHLPEDSRLERLPPILLAKIMEAMGEATTCWSDFASAGTFDSTRLNELTQHLAIDIANEIELVAMRRKTDTGVDWRRRALEAEQRADVMQAGMLEAESARLHERTRRQAGPAHAPKRPSFFRWLKNLF